MVGLCRHVGVVLFSISTLSFALLEPRLVKRQRFLASMHSSRKLIPREPRSGELLANAANALRRQIGAILLSVAMISTPLVVEPPQQCGALPAILRVEALALNDEQSLVLEVWKEVNRQFVDGSFNGLGDEGWKKKKLEAVKVLTASEGDSTAAYAAIRTMLASLNDPYTRFLTPDQYAVLSSVAKGASAGIGVQLQVDPVNGAVVVLSTIANGPAAVSGVQPGDQIVQVDGEDMKGVPAEFCAARLRGQPGTSLNLELRRGDKMVDLTLTRAAVKVTPVQWHRAAVDEKEVGIVELKSFSQETTAQLVDALRALGSVDALAIDLRGNSGGFMPAGKEGASLFLPANVKIISEVKRDGTIDSSFADGIGADIKTPLVLLVDERTASASEIMAAALQDNKRAVLVSSSKTAHTFGKGRIQNVQELADGSAITVTRAKYVTPTGKDIHGIGLFPDKQSTTCGPADSPESCLRGLL